MPDGSTKPTPLRGVFSLKRNTAFHASQPYLAEEVHTMTRSPNALGFLVLVAAVSGLLSASAASAPAGSSGPRQDTAADRAELLRLNEQMIQSQIVDRDPAFFERIAVEEFRVLAPGGLIENKKQAIAGVKAWSAKSVKLSATQVVFHGPVAVVMGRMDIDGVMKPVGRWGPLKYMSTWVREGNDWKLLSRSLTPCLDKLVEMGRC